jgi:hypothetical protein
VDNTDLTSGYNTDHALVVLKYILPPPDQTRVRLMVRSPLVFALPSHSPPQTIFFGANDCCVRLKERNQCVDLPVFEKNLIKMVQHPAVLAHAPAIVLVTPPPNDERRQRAVDAAKGYPVRRTAESTRAYADKVRKVGRDLGVPVVDLWTRFMQLAGWEEGDERLPGSVDLPVNDKFEELMHDGESPAADSCVDADDGGGGRLALGPSGVQGLLRGAEQLHRGQLS